MHAYICNCFMRFKYYLIKCKKVSFILSSQNIHVAQKTRDLATSLNEDKLARLRITCPTPLWVRIPPGTLDSFMWGGYPAILRGVGVSTQVHVPARTWNNARRGTPRSFSTSKAEKSSDNIYNGGATKDRYDCYVCGTSSGLKELLCLNGRVDIH